MLARAEVANDLLYNDPKRVVIEEGSVRAHQDTLESLADVSSPLDETRPSPLAEAGSSLLAPRSAPDSYKEYPPGDERALPDFILRSHGMSEVDEATSAWAAAFDTLPDGEFWRAVVDDADGLRARAPLHLAAKIRAGVPARVRGVVWQTLTQARSTYLQTVYTQLVAEHSPHERVIRRDLPRTFPKVPVFKREGGEAQQRLFRILKAYSLYDAEVGYCQGLGFIIGPLIMSMGECEAFCVLVRLMETYDLRGMFTEDMGGLHLRLYQFQALASEIVPGVMSHLAAQGVVAAMYVPSWFLSLFAYTMPLSFVLRAMDVIMAERAPEAIIRIGIALLQRNADKITAQEDFESAMRVLNAGLYDDDACARDRPGFVLQEAARLSAVVTPQRLTALEAQYCKEQGLAPRSRGGGGNNSEDSGQAVPPTPSLAIKFLGWPWSSRESAASRTSTVSPSSPSTPSSASESPQRVGSISPRVLELTPAQREQSRLLREQILKSLQEQDNSPATALGPTRQVKQRSEVKLRRSSLSTATIGDDSDDEKPRASDSMWRDQVLEPLERQLHDARVSSDSHRDALVALQAEHDALRAELALAKAQRAGLAEENEQLQMRARRLDAAARADRATATEQQEALVAARLKLAEADEERSLLLRQLSNLRKFIAADPEDDTQSRSRMLSIDAERPPATAPPKQNRFSISSLTNWSAIRDAIASPPPVQEQQQQQQPKARRSSITVRSSPATSPPMPAPPEVGSRNSSTSVSRHAAPIPLSMLHRSRTMPTAPAPGEDE
ncbi:hypothetical protein GGF46_003615 [Coemansia sp. RSA 552]|nr:hypothetical protein GGF46_003615 [Coemansia sp. RSA 552]